MTYLKPIFSFLAQLIDLLQRCVGFEQGVVDALTKAKCGG